MPSFENDDSSSEDSDSEDEEELTNRTFGEKIASTFNTVYDKSGAALVYVKPYVHVAWIPLVLFLGSSEPPFPSWFELITPPMWTNHHHNQLN